MTSPAEWGSLASRAWRHYRTNGLRSLGSRMRAAVRYGTWGLEPVPARLPAGVDPVDPRGIVAALDAPTREWVETSEAIVVSGWACSADEVDRIEIYLDGAPVGEVRPAIMRPDVAQRLSKIPQAATSGFSTAVRLDGVPLGLHDLVVAVRDRAGRCRVYGRTFELFDRDDAYDLYYRATLPTRDEVRALRRRLKGHASIHLWLDGDADGDLAGTIRSIAAQEHVSWQCSVVAGEERSAAARHVLEASVPADRRDRFTVQPRPASPVPGDGGVAVYHGFLRPGERLSPQALLRYAARFADGDADVVYADHDVTEESGRHVQPWFVPDWSPDHLLSRDYVGGFFLLRWDRTLAEAVSDVFPPDRRAWRFELFLAATDDEATKVVHVPDVLWSSLARGAAATETDAESAAVRAALQRRGQEAEVRDTEVAGIRRVVWPVAGEPKVSIVIPTTGRLSLVQPCVETILGITAYRAFELVFIDNGRGSHPDGIEYLRSQGLQVLERNEPFNWAKLNNDGARIASGELLLFLNDDIEVVEPGWLTELVAQAMRPGIGAVGGLLLYPDGRIQHAGVRLVGHGGGAMHWFQLVDPRRGVYLDLDHVTREVSANTGACLMVQRSRFEEVGGFDERFVVASNDVDFCLRLQEAGYRNLWTPDCRLVHHEGVSRASIRVDLDEVTMRQRWKDLLRNGDRYANRNFAPDRSDCSFEVTRSHVSRFRQARVEELPGVLVQRDIEPVQGRDPLP